MASYRISRLDLDIRGVDPATVKAALDALPAALETALAEATYGPPRMPGPSEYRFDDPASLAEGIASRLAAQLRAERYAPAMTAVSPGAVPPAAVSQDLAGGFDRRSS